MLLLRAAGISYSNRNSNNREPCQKQAEQHQRPATHRRVEQRQNGSSGSNTHTDTNARSATCHTAQQQRATTHKRRVARSCAVSIAERRHSVHNDVDDDNDHDHGVNDDDSAGFRSGKRVCRGTRAGSEIARPITNSTQKPNAQTTYTYIPYLHISLLLRTLLIQVYTLTHTHTNTHNRLLHDPGASASVCVCRI